MLILPKDYQDVLDVRQTQSAIKLLKDTFERELSGALNLMRVSAPLFVTSDSGLNDNLNGVERPVCFATLEMPERQVEIVQSLAKWKRMALGRYGYGVGEGLYTDMNAIRRDEVTDNLHSIYVDQWDWEKIIGRNERTEDMLHSVVRSIYAVFKKVEKTVLERFPQLTAQLPDEITFITSQQLEDMYPDLTPKEREHEAARQYGALFLSQIGGTLKSGTKHDGRAPDYDDWQLNGDIIFYFGLLDVAFEISSMGIRVDKHALLRQLELAGCLERAQLPFHRALLEEALPQSIGGGIGQSRLCMFFLQKAHIGQVQASLWMQEAIEMCRMAGIRLL
ncbi:MAG: aspartate--ammonia ligase [Christensenellales bacterium]|jgi:aspartate--ammonia ligase